MANKNSSNADRCRTYRERKKESDPDFVKKERQRLKEYREKQKREVSQKKKEELKQKERERKQRYRQQKTQQKKENTAKNERKPYKTKQTLGKAIKKTEKSLPRSPTKKRAVIQGLAVRAGMKLQSEMEQDMSGKGRSLSQDTLQLVREFFYRPDIVYTMPGMKDEMTVWVEGKKERLRKHYLTVFLKEAYALFQSAYPDVSISFSKFCELRPKNVLLLHDSPADQCRCKIHENFFLMLKGLSIQYSSATFWASILCDPSSNSRCWKVECDECDSGKRLSIDVSPESMVTWREWETVERNSAGKTGTFLQCVTHTGTASGLLHKVKSSMDKVVLHIHTKRVQAAEFESDKSSENIRVLQMDFAMNYLCEYQNEVQSALWSIQSVMLYTAASMHKKEVKTYLICSDSKDKGKDTICVFINSLYDTVLKEDDGVCEEVIWTDGPSSEFKNRFMVRLLASLGQKFKRNFTWKYFATSHGKGIVDGVGGRAKSLVRSSVMSKGTNAPVVQCSTDFAALAGCLLDKTSVSHISHNDIVNSIENLKPWKKVRAVPGIQKVHVIRYEFQSRVIKMWQYAQDEESVVAFKV